MSYEKQLVCTTGRTHENGNDNVSLKTIGCSQKRRAGTSKTMVVEAIEDAIVVVVKLTISHPFLRFSHRHQHLTDSEVRFTCMMLVVQKTPIAIRGALGKVIIVSSSMNSDLEAFNHNPTDDSLAALAFYSIIFWLRKNHCQSIVEWTRWFRCQKTERKHQL